jgi:hypothetical protein
MTARFAMLAFLGALAIGGIASSRAQPTVDVPVTSASVADDPVDDEAAVDMTGPVNNLVCKPPTQCVRWADPAHHICTECR